MATIKDIVAKLDVLLPQVLIESVIMDVTLEQKLEFRRVGGAKSAKCSVLTRARPAPVV